MLEREPRKPSASREMCKPVHSERARQKREQFHPVSLANLGPTNRNKQFFLAIHMQDQNHWDSDFSAV